MTGTLHEQYPGASHDDLGLYFTHTWMKIAGKWAWVRGFDTLDSGERTISYCFADEFDRNLSSPTKKLNEIHPEFLPTGYYNLRGSVVYFTRSTKRQTKKSMCQATFPEESLLSSIINDYTRLWQETSRIRIPSKIATPYDFRYNEGHGIIHEVLTNYTNWYTPFPDAFRSLQKQSLVARAISPDFMLSLGVFGEEPTLWYKEIPVGVALADNIVSVTDELFNQEVLDMFAGNNNVTVKVAK